MDSLGSDLLLLTYLHILKSRGASGQLLSRCLSGKGMWHAPPEKVLRDSGKARRKASLIRWLSPSVMQSSVSMPSRDSTVMIADEFPEIGVLLAEVSGRDLRGPARRH